MLGSIARTCALRGYDLLTSFQQLSSNWHVDYEDSRKADGIILLGYGDYETLPRAARTAGRAGHAFRALGLGPAGPAGATIGCDNAAAGAHAGEHLIALGRRRIAFLGEASSHYPEFQDRYRGACDGDARRRAIEPIPALQVDAITTEASGYEAAQRTARARRRRSTRSSPRAT